MNESSRPPSGDPSLAPSGDPSLVPSGDRTARRVLWSMPSGLYVLGSKAGDRLNAMTLSWATQASMKPRLVAVGVANSSFTHELISEGSIFALTVLAREDRSVVRKFVKPVDVDLETSTLNGFVFSERVTGAPILDIAIGYLDCEVRQAVPTGDHTLFVGEVVDAGFHREESCPVLRMEDTRMSYGG